MNLQYFATSVIETMGGIVEPIEYALCQVLIPEEYKNAFNGKTELLLAFDFEVAEENPESEFITFGSYILDRLIELIKEKTLCTIRYVHTDRLYLEKAEDKIKKFLKIERGIVRLLKQEVVIGSFAAYNFITGYSAEERREESIEIWVDLITNKISTEMHKHKVNIFYESKPVFFYPYADIKSVVEAFEAAFENLKTIIEIRKSSFNDNQLLKQEVKRIEEYYNELITENRKKKHRKGITAEKIKELDSKEETLFLEKQRQLKEMEEKYTVKTDIALDNAAIYFVPLIECSIITVISNEEQEKILYYNAITKGWFIK
jgi:hypothetical protein